MTNDVAVDFGRERRAIADALTALCARGLGDVAPPVREAIHYALTGEGKRLRGLLLLSAFEAASEKDCHAIEGGARVPRSEAVGGLAAAIEVVHAYSLVHDDLPCMDDDDMRRGRPTIHRVYGVEVATAAGLTMVPLAVRQATDAARALGLDDEATAEIVRDLMRAAGAGGMIGGQLLDLEGEGKPLSLAELERIHRAKTGALITAAATLGGRAAGAPARRLAALAQFGAAIGLAFQIADDVLDVTGTTDQLGKTAGRDLALRKSTYPALLGVDGARARAESLVHDGCAALEREGLLTAALAQIARFTVERTS